MRDRQCQPRKIQFTLCSRPQTKWLRRNPVNGGRQNEHASTEFMSSTRASCSIGARSASGQSRRFAKLLSVRYPQYGPFTSDWDLASPVALPRPNGQTDRRRPRQLRRSALDRPKRLKLTHAVEKNRPIKTAPIHAGAAASCCLFLSEGGLATGLAQDRRGADNDSLIAG